MAVERYQRATGGVSSRAWGNHHLITQQMVMDTLPAPPSIYEPLLTFAYLAGQTSRIRLVVATIVAPLRDPVLLAKQAATLDQASLGRFVLGLGISSSNSSR